MHRAVAGLFVLLGLGLTGSTRAQPVGALCELRDTLSLTPLSPHGMVLVESTLYVGDFDDGLAIFDVSDVRAPLLIGSLAFPDKTGDLVVDGQTAVCETRGLQIVDVSDPTAPELVSQLPNSATAMALRDDLLCVADPSAGLVVFDLSEPRTPQELARLPFDGVARALLIERDIAYIGAEDGGLHIVDLADPEEPEVLATFAEPQDIFDLTLQSGIVYLTDSLARLMVVDVSDPSNPVHLATFDADRATMVAVDGNRCYLAGAMHVLDISDPSDPRAIGGYSTFGSLHGTVRDGVGYFGSGGLRIVDVSDPPERSDPPYALIFGTPVGLDAEGDVAFVATSEMGVSAIDIGDPDSPELVDWLPINDFVYDVRVVDGHMFVAGQTTLYVYDVSDPTEPELIGVIDITGRQLDLREGILYVAGFSFACIDVSDPSNPQVLGQVGGGGVTDLQVVDDLAFVADTTEGLWIIDVSDPSSPEVLSITELGWWSDGLYVDGDLVYIVTPAARIAILDVTDPTLPSIIFEHSGSPIIAGEDVIVVGDHAFLALYGELSILDVSVPSQTRRIGRVLPGHARGYSPEFLIRGDRAFVPTDQAGLVVLDLSDCPCTADFDGNGTADSRDFIAYLGAWAQQRTHDCSAGDCSADLNGDGVVDTRDFLEFLGAWAAGCG